jgi:RHS repeat-associated protein
MQAAGGVGGLLWLTDHTGQSAGTHFAAYDGNGNVVALSAASDGSETARYEYGPFGEPIRVTGPAATLNPFRFSTKRTNPTTDLVLYEYRVYSPSTGWWLSRDPIGELGGYNLYGFVGNSPLNKVDRLGLRDDPGPTTPPCTPGCPICSPPPDPPKGKPGYHDIPYWFEHPVDEGKPCCCEPPGKLKKFERTDDPPTRTKLSFKIDVQLEGCYKDLAIVWWTCWRPDGSGGYMPGFNNQTSASLDVYGITIPGVGDLSTGPHITQAYIRYLSCENGKWVKHKESKGRTYVWHDGQWTW